MNKGHFFESFFMVAVVDMFDCTYKPFTVYKKLQSNIVQIFCNSWAHNLKSYKSFIFSSSSFVSDFQYFIFGFLWGENLKEKFIGIFLKWKPTVEAQTNQNAWRSLRFEDSLWIPDPSNFPLPTAQQRKETIVVSILEKKIEKII